jgi:hypothetical protein
VWRKGGDVLAFFMKRHNLDFKSAAMELGAWKQIGEADRRRIANEKRKREQEQFELIAKQEAQKRERLKVRDWLHTVETLYRDLETRLTRLRRGEPENSEGEADQLMQLLSFLLDQIRDAEREYISLSGLNNAK